MKSEIDDNQSKVSCDERMSRHEFVGKLVKQATVLGTLALAPAIVEQFIAPPAVAAASGGGGGGGGPISSFTIISG